MKPLLPLHARHPIAPARCAAALAAALLAAAAGCGKRAYEAAPLNPPATAARQASRSLDDPALRDYLERHGRSVGEWPLAQWSLAELTLAAFHFNPQAAAARAEAQAAQAAVPASALRDNPRLMLGPQYNTNPDPGQSPWTVSVALEFPVNTADRRSAREEAAQAEAEAARLAAAGEAWRARAEVRRQWLALHAARAAAALAARQIDAESAALALVERRIEAGYAAATDAQPVRLRIADLRSEQARALAAAESARAALAAAIGVPAGALAARRIAAEDIALLPRPEQLPPRAVEGEALLNRLDLRAALARYAAAEARVKLEVAKQYPEITLSPGYEWDQGANRWSLGIGLLLGMLHTNEAGIARAEAQRAAQAARVEALQAQAAAEAEGARIRYLAALQALAAARAAESGRAAAEQRALRRLQAGEADRLEVAVARSETVAAGSHTLAALVAAQTALGALEDALQRPLDPASAALLPLPDMLARTK